MLNIPIHPRQLSASADQVRAFFSDLRHLEELMPESVTQFEADESRCSFKLGSLGKIGLEINAEASDSDKVLLQTINNIPFPVQLHINIKALEPQTTEVGMNVQADMNPFMQMMAAKPLEQFLGHLLKKLAERFSS